MARQSTVDDIYPVTIMATRYSGVYEGGLYAAFHCYPHEVPKDTYDDDSICSEWWFNPPMEPLVGVGDTPEDALAELAAFLFSHEAVGGLDDGG